MLYGWFDGGWNFHACSTLSDLEESSLFFISGYVAFKEGLALQVDDPTLFQNSEILSLLSRGKLSYPPAELFELGCILFCYYKNVKKTCIKHVLIAFNEIYECCQLEYKSHSSILRRFLNCFSKAFSNDECDKLKVERNNVKRKRLSFDV